MSHAIILPGDSTWIPILPDVNVCAGRGCEQCTGTEAEVVQARFDEHVLAMQSMVGSFSDCVRDVLDVTD